MKFRIKLLIVIISIGSIIQANNPTGPFKDARGETLIVNEMTKDNAQDWDGIDPSVFIDKDDQAYLYWDNGNCKWVKLKDNMIEFDGPIHNLSGREDNQKDGQIDIGKRLNEFKGSVVKVLVGMVGIQTLHAAEDSTKWGDEGLEVLDEAVEESEKELEKEKKETKQLEKKLSEEKKETQRLKEKSKRLDKIIEQLDDENEEIKDENERLDRKIESLDRKIESVNNNLRNKIERFIEKIESGENISDKKVQWAKTTLNDFPDLYEKSERKEKLEKLDDY